jgi:hypothetical protein
MKNVSDMTMDEVFALTREIEREHHCRISMVTKEDVNDIYKMAIASEGIESHDMTDEQWEKFIYSWFWSKGYSEVMWDGVQEAVAWDMRDDGIVPDTVVVE